MNYTTHWPSPLGLLRLSTDGQALSEVVFADGPRPHSDVEHPLLAQAITRLAAYFAAPEQPFSLPLVGLGTPFQQVVWRAIAAVPCGTTISYGELAARLGHPGAARAVGTALGRNPWHIIVPCHRAVGSDGQLHGYAGGLSRKAALLALERETTVSQDRRPPAMR